MKNNNSQAMVGCMVVIAIIIICMSWSYFISFHIYKKKHGDKLSYIEYLFDTERK